MSATENLARDTASEVLTLDKCCIAPAVSTNTNTIQADVAYLKYESKHELEKLYTMNYDTGDTFPRTNAKNELKTISIQNVRKSQAHPSFETCGFTTKKLQSSLSMAEFDDSDKVEAVFYTEVKDLLQELYPNARAIEVLEHQVVLTLT